MKRFMMFSVGCLCLCLFLSNAAEAQGQCAVMTASTCHKNNSLIASLVYNSSSQSYSIHIAALLQGGSCDATFSLTSSLPQDGEVLGIGVSTLEPAYGNAVDFDLGVIVSYADGKTYKKDISGMTCQYHQQGTWHLINDFGFDCTGTVSTNQSTWGSIKKK